MKSTFSAQQNLIEFSIKTLKTAKFDITAHFAQSGSAFRKRSSNWRGKKLIKNLCTAFQVALHRSLLRWLQAGVTPLYDSLAFMLLWETSAPAGFGL